jgi:predicted unusual protein kinase regulating ubiquinone biosynthesis (AarF/ABC1/UbiB family)
MPLLLLLQLFRSFDRRPIAAASLGQVHRAVLHTGEEVVVKVQRPALKQLFDIDLNNLRILAEQLDKGDENRDFKVGSLAIHNQQQEFTVSLHSGRAAGQG